MFRSHSPISPSIEVKCFLCRFLPSPHFKLFDSLFSRHARQCLGYIKNHPEKPSPLRFLSQRESDSPDVISPSFVFEKAAWDASDRVGVGGEKSAWMDWMRLHHTSEIKFIWVSPSSYLALFFPRRTYITLALFASHSTTAINIGDGPFCHYAWA